jgi:hypothetical protein
MKGVDTSLRKTFLVKYDLYTLNFDKVYDPIKKAHNKNPTPKTTEMLNALHQIAIYINSVEADLNAMVKINSDGRLDKNRAILRARRSEAEFEDFKNKYKL